MSTVEASLAALHESAVRALQQAGRAAPGEVSSAVDVAEVAVVELRDALIDLHRAASPPDRWRPSLDRVNAVLSLVVGLEYPATGLQTKLLDQALAALQAIRF